MTVSTQNETQDGKVKNLGDKEVVAVPSPKPTANVTIPVKTVADIKPSQKVVEEAKPVGKISPPVPVVHIPQAAAKSAEANLDAHFVKDAIVDGTTIAPNARFTQVWTLSNPGPRVWPAGCSVRLVGGDNMLNVENTRAASVSDINEATESNVIGREVLPGEEVAFMVLLKAPSREGKSISYWRVKSCDGIPFGHKLWCDITVKKVEAPAETNKPIDPVNQAQIAEYWQGYQQRMAAIRLANAQRQAAGFQQRAQEIRATNRHGAFQAQLDVAATYQAQADWRRQMEEFVRRTNASNMLQPAASDDGSKADMSVKSEPVSFKAATEAVAQDKDELKDSQMIFPTLERESPSSSIYESIGSSVAKAAFVEDKQTGIKVADASLASAPASEVAGVPEEQDVGVEDEGFEDISELEVLSADGEEASDDGGFMTDEEYDILDASDQETVASK